MFEKLRKKPHSTEVQAQNGSGSPVYTDVHARRDELAASVAEMTWDLGGLTYEMAIRDHFRIDVLVRRASELQEVDAELGEVERLLASEYEGISGGCRACGAPHSRGAVFCWQCGNQIIAEAQSAVVTGVTAPDAAPPQPTQTPLQPAEIEAVPPQSPALEPQTQVLPPRMPPPPR